MTSLYRNEILKLEDEKERVRYLLGGLNREDHTTCTYNRFWGCDLRCPTMPLEEDERLLKIYDFMEKHNIGSGTMLKFSRTLLHNRFNPYHHDLGQLIPELSKVLADYHFITIDDSYSENDYKELELMEFIIKNYDNENSTLRLLLAKYNITIIDFIILAKTSLNYKYYSGLGIERTDLSKDIADLLTTAGIHDSYEKAVEYQKKYNK